MKLKQVVRNFLIKMELKEVQKPLIEIGRIRTS